MFFNELIMCFWIYLIVVTDSSVLFYFVFCNCVDMGAPANIAGLDVMYTIFKK